MLVALSLFCTNFFNTSFFLTLFLHSHPLTAPHAQVPVMVCLPPPPSPPLTTKIQTLTPTTTPPPFTSTPPRCGKRRRWPRTRRTTAIDTTNRPHWWAGNWIWRRPYPQAWCLDWFVDWTEELSDSLTSTCFLVALTDMRSIRNERVDCSLNLRLELVCENWQLNTQIGWCTGEKVTVGSNRYFCSAQSDSAIME